MSQEVQVIGQDLDYLEGRCLACGTRDIRHSKRFCSKSCKETTLHALGWLSPLLRRLDTKLASLWFTESELILCVVRADSKHANKFVRLRNIEIQITDDIKEMALALGEIWHQHLSWSEAVPGVLDCFSNETVPAELEFNNSPMIPAVHLKVIGLKDSDLRGRNAVKAVKDAFRRQAMKHHPDKGGGTKDFRKLQDCYHNEILPRFEYTPNRSNPPIPGKWLFDAACGSGRWKPPATLG